MEENIDTDLLFLAEKAKGIVLAVILLQLHFLMSTGVAHANLTGSSVTVEAPQPIATATFDLVFKMTLFSNDGEFVDRLYISLPLGWTINALTAPPANSSVHCPGVGTQTSTIGQTVIWEIAGGYAEGSTCGPWMAEMAGTDFSFIVNVTVPDCSGRPWVLPWTINGDGWGGAPHEITGDLNIDNCVVPTIDTAGGYTFTTIDHPEAIATGFGTTLTDINDHGLMVGYYEATGSVERSFFYDGMVFTPIDYPGATSTKARGVNNSGHVVGGFIDGDGYHGFIFNGSTYIPMTLPGFERTELSDINDNNHTTGSVTAGVWNSEGFYFDGSSLKHFNYPGSSLTFSHGINNSNQLVGHYYGGAAGVHGFRYNGTSFTDINYPGAVYSEARHISDTTIVGKYLDTDHKWHGFLFDGVARYTRFDYPEAVYTAVAALNKNGDLVGSYSDDSGPGHGFLAKKFPWPVFYPAFIRKE